MKRWLSLLGTLLGQPLWVVFGFGLSAFAVVGVFGGLLEEAHGNNKLLIGLVVNAVVYMLALLLVLLPLKLVGQSVGNMLSLLGLTKKPRMMSYLKTVGIFFVYIAALYAVMILARLLLSQWINFDEKQDVGIKADDLTQVYQYVLAFVTLVVLAPVFEELLFRGYLYGKLRQRFGFWLSAIVASLTFGFVHGQINVAIDTFILGMFLAYLRESSGSIWPAVLLHAMKNGLAYYLLFIVKLG